MKAGPYTAQMALQQYISTQHSSFELQKKGPVWREETGRDGRLDLELEPAAATLPRGRPVLSSLRR